MDGIPDGRPIHVKNIYKCAFKNIRICVDGAFHDSVTTNMNRIVSFFFFISLIFNSLNSEALICMRRPNSEGFLKGARFLPGFTFLCKLGLLFFKRRWDYQI